MLTTVIGVLVFRGVQLPVYCLLAAMGCDCAMVYWICKAAAHGSF